MEDFLRFTKSSGLDGGTVFATFQQSFPSRFFGRVPLFLFNAQMALAALLETTRDAMLIPLTVYNGFAEKEE